MAIKVNQIGRRGDFDSTPIEPVRSLFYDNAFKTLPDLALSCWRLTFVWIEIRCLIELVFDAITLHQRRAHMQPPKIAHRT